MDLKDQKKKLQAAKKSDWVDFKKYINWILVIPSKISDYASASM